MSDKFTALDRKTFKNYIDLMRELINAGFDNEFDNSLVIRAIIAKIDAVLSLAGTVSGIYLQTLCENDSQGEKLLKITIRSTVSERAQESLIVFAQGDTIKVGSNVLVEPVKGFKQQTQTLHYPFLPKQEAIKLLSHFEHTHNKSVPKMTLNVLDALFKELAPVSYENQLLASVSVDKEKIKVQFHLNIQNLCAIEFALAQN